MSDHEAEAPAIGAAQVEHPSETPAPPPTSPLYFYDSRTGCMVPAEIHHARVARTRARNTPAKRRSRAKQKAEIVALCADLEPLPPIRLSADERLHEARRFRDWLNAGGKRQQQFKPLEFRYLGARIMLLQMRLENEQSMGVACEPKPAVFARRLSNSLGEPISRAAALQILRQLATLEGDGGPWSVMR